METRTADEVLKENEFQLRNEILNTKQYREFILEVMEEYASQFKQEPERCPVCKKTFLTDRVCLTCTKELRTEINELTGG